jgi:hypothetical protein
MMFSSDDGGAIFPLGNPTQAVITGAGFVHLKQRVHIAARLARSHDGWPMAPVLLCDAQSRLAPHQPVVQVREFKAYAGEAEGRKL